MSAPGRSRRWGAGRIAVLGVAAAFVALLVYGLLAQSPDRSIDDALADGQPLAAPAFELPVLEGGRPPARLAPVLERAAADGRIALRELRGTPVVLNFWASWCTPCKDEAPVLQRAWRQAGSHGALLLGVNVADSGDDARAFSAGLGLTYPSVKEAGKEILRRYGATGLPETYFLDRDGRVVFHVIGSISDAQMRAGLAAARAGRSGQPQRGGAQRDAG